MQGSTSKLCLVGVILGRMENEKDKSGEKIIFLIVQLRVKKMSDFGGVYKFSLLPSKHTISLNWKENESKKWAKIFGKIAHIFFFIFWLPRPSCKCGLPTVFSFGFNWMLIFFFFFKYDDMRIRDTPQYHTVLFLGCFFFLIF